MIAASIGKKQIGKILLGAIAVVIVVVGAIYLIGKPKADEGATVIEGATAEQREAYLLSVGLQVDKTSSVAEVIVPKEFDERFSEYNEMLKTTNFDLAAYKGETVKKCTYIVTNRGDLGTSISAVLLVHDGKIVAGHIIDNDTSRLYPLFEAAQEEQAQPDAEETIIPSDGLETETNAGSETAMPENEDVPETENDAETDETAGYPTD